MIIPGSSEVIFFRDAQLAFEDAIAAGLLSLDRASDTWVGYYMYMGTLRANSQDLFKHVWTRAYLPVRHGHAEAT